jgi:1-acyl-sn-glycerol-3-phosphate acyltransferase
VFYRLVRAVVSVALSLFYKLEVLRQVSDLGGPVMFVGNHPNSLIDPALVFVITERPVTFLAREGLFRVPLLGWVLKGLGALPVFRKQDNPNLMAKNEGTLDAAAGALQEAKAITIFPEGKSHSDPQLSDIKTGCARIALKVAKSGAALRVVPIGFTYARKHHFRSKVHIEVGEPVLVEAVAGLSPEAETDWVRALTARVGAALQGVTLNLETWEDLAVIETADQLFALQTGSSNQDPERLRLWAKGASLMRAEQPEEFDEVKEDLMAFRRRLRMVHARPEDLSLEYRHREVLAFALENLAALLFGFPVFLLGLVLFALPFVGHRLLATLIPATKDRVATVKFTLMLFIAPAWWVLLTVLAALAWGPVGLAVAVVGLLPLALFTRYFIEHWRTVAGDVLTFFQLGNARRLRARLLADGERLQEEMVRLAAQYRDRLG